jgi:hypothetical protein
MAENTPRTHEAQAVVKVAERKRRFEERQAWIDAIQRRRDLSPAARLIGGRLGWHKNLKTGQCNPGYGTLADESGYPLRTAKRAIAELERKGCITINRTAGGLETNSYTLMTGVTTSPVAEHVTGDKRRTSPVSPRHPNLEELPVGDAYASPNRGRESVAHVRNEPPRPVDGRADARPPGKREGKQEDAGFDQLRVLWQRPWIDDDRAAKRAYAIACREGANPGDIAEAAAAWIAAADAPRFLPPLARWLAGHGWEKVPPVKRTPCEAAGRRQRNSRRDRKARLHGAFLRYAVEADAAEEAWRRSQQ